VQTGTKADGNPATQIVEKTYIPEGDVYRLIIRSKLPTAARFEAWVCDTVLPGLRRDGAYITPATVEKIREDKAFADSLLNRLTAERAKTTALMDCVEKLTPKAQYHDAVLQAEGTIPVSIIAKDYGMTAASFNKLLHSLGVQYKVRNTWLLYSRHHNKGYALSSTVKIGDEAKVHTTWTQAGRAFLYDLLKYYGILPTTERTSCA